jgi:hypothetical protein
VGATEARATKLGTPRPLRFTALARSAAHRFSPFFLPSSPVSSNVPSSPSAGAGVHSAQSDA